MSAIMLATYVGRSGRLTVERLAVDVKVVDARIRYGETQLLVAPIAGTGEQWVSQYRVALD